MPDWCGNDAGITQESRGNHTGITRESHGNHAEANAGGNRKRGKQTGVPARRARLLATAECHPRPTQISGNAQMSRMRPARILEL
jgi:hypothetical protein